MKLCLSPGQHGDAPVGRELVRQLGRAPTRRYALLVERLFGRRKAYRRVFTRYDKLDTMFLTFIHLGFVFDALRLC